jgi:hypothetical protein
MVHSILLYLSQRRFKIYLCENWLPIISRWALAILVKGVYPIIAVFGLTKNKRIINIKVE